MRKKIIIDLDVVTIAIWNKSGAQFDMANKFVKRIKNKEFYVVSPHFVIERVLEWEFESLKEKIKEYYLNNSNKLLSDTEISSKMQHRNADPNVILPALITSGVKDEDALLALVASLFDLDYLVTFNRKHLRNNVDKINAILRRYGLNDIKIVLPNEI
ncbi:hypothetical protein HYX09_02805 [Candidatus Woesearchaeota archaeon]|nr:hypothetical protein [Candidatus Woesearchaeota archaeon]